MSHTTSPSAPAPAAVPAIPGRVWAHVGQPFGEPYFDVVVVGAGRMGAACTLYLRQLAPQLSVLLVEESGLPNEEGATILAPGLWTTFDVPESQLDAARWTRQQLEHALGDIQFQTRPLVELAAEALPGMTAQPVPDLPAGLLNPAALTFARQDAQAATFRPGSVALNAAQQAIKLGASLLLNTRARLLPGDLLAGDSPTLRLERLTVTNTHQIVTHETRDLRAGAVILAGGASGPGQLEYELGVHTRHTRAYVQYPRLNLASANQTPVLRVRDHSGVRLTLRPQQGGWTLVPRIPHRDPHGYQPQGGHLTGVPTGLRREVLEDLVALMDAVPALQTGALQLGHSLSDVAGAWVALPQGQPGTPPQWEEVAPHTYLLLGGPLADTLGLATAYALAGQLAGE